LWDCSNRLVEGKVYAICQSQNSLADGEGQGGFSPVLMIPFMPVRCGENMADQLDLNFLVVDKSKELGFQT